MKKKIFLFGLILLFCNIQIEAQVISIMKYESEEGGNKLDTLQKEIIDQAKYRVYYSISFINDTSRLSREEGQTILQIGSKYNAFLDYNVLRMDSIHDKLVSENIEIEELIPTMINFKKLIKFDPTIIKNYPERGKSIFQQKVSSDMYRYTDNIKIEWQLQEEEKEIEGYTCKKANCHYKGRNYIAWYAPEVPITEGPYVFSGLPGLIMEIGDTENHYRFLLNGLVAVDYYDPIYILTDKVVEVSRKEFRKMIHNIKTDPSSLLKSMGVSDGKGQSVSIKVNGSSSDMSMDEILAKMGKRPYNPIELE